MQKTKVVILNWNGEKHLRQFLPSVVASTPKDVGIVVADNGSTDNSVEMLEKEFPCVEILKMSQNYGFAGGYNRALKEIDADIYILLNSDVETPQGWVEPLLSSLNENPQVAAVAPKLRAFRQKDAFEYAGASGGYIDFLGYPFCRGRILRHTEKDTAQYDDSREVFWVSGAAFCCRAKVFHQMGGFDEEFFAHMEEIDLCWRMQLAGYQVRIVPQSVVYHLGGGTLQVDSPNKVYFNHRNNLAMLYKCSTSYQRFWVAILRPFLDFLAAISYLLQGHYKNAWAVARAWKTFLEWHPRLKRQRKEIQRGKQTIGNQNIYRGSIVLRYMFGRKIFDKMM